MISVDFLESEEEDMWVEVGVVELEVFGGDVNELEVAFGEYISVICLHLSGEVDENFEGDVFDLEYF